MKRASVVVFDVDNTIIRGNLTFFFIKFLAKRDGIIRALRALWLRGDALTQTAKELLTKELFDKKVYPEAIEKIAHHLRNKQNIVVLLSGSPQELLNILFKHICEKLREKSIKYECRFFARGTQLRPRLKICVGKRKIRALKRLLKEQKYDDYEILYTYSDNKFMADLALLKKSIHGGVLICQKHAGYLALPKKLLERFTFMPFWNP